MGQFFDELSDSLIEWIQQQHIYWVATAPLSPTGHVNVSPKGLAGTFNILDKRTVMYQDLSGSGNETISHLRENGRITLLFQAFDGPPRICRLFGTGTWHEAGTPSYEELIPPADRLAGSRSAIVVKVHKVGTSCGYGVPYYDFVGHRKTLTDHFAKLEAQDEDDPNGLSEKGLHHYTAIKNWNSIDGLPGLYSAEKYLDVFPNAQRIVKPFENNGKVHAFGLRTGDGFEAKSLVAGIVFGILSTVLLSRALSLFHIL